MQSHSDLRNRLQRIDRRGYKAYQQIKGTYQFETFTLMIDHVQGDPFAEPSRMRVRVSQSLALFPADSFSLRSREIALRDLLTREFHRATGRVCTKASRGTGRSGLIRIDAPGQEILERTSCFVNDRFVEIRFRMGLPAAGRTILAHEALEMFFGELPDIVAASLFFKRLNPEALYEHIQTNQDQDYLREQLGSQGLVAFVADGARLPRRSGVDDQPLEQDSVPFRSPDTLRCSFILPNSGKVSGMGIRQGVTLVVGGGYHGKSTLLDAVQRSVYNQIPGDGRELCVTVPEAVKIRAEDGRNIEKVDISPFINDLPYGKKTTAFRTPNASGSTSQAANIIEMLEMGASALLIDEDTSATNFMIRDRRMQMLVSKEKEPITPLLDKIRSLHADLGVSTVLVMGGSGDYFDVADTVIAMQEYLPREVTAEAKRVASEVPTGRRSEGGGAFGRIRQRVPIASSIDASRGRWPVKINVREGGEIGFGRHSIDISALEQLVNTSQVRALATALIYLRNTYLDGRRSLREGVELVLRDFQETGLDVLGGQPSGEYALPRKLEVAAVLNRLRTLKVTFRDGEQG